MKDHLHQECYARSCQEIQECWKTLLSGGNTEKQRRLEEFLYAARSGITNRESILPRSWLTAQLWHTYVPHQALITSSSRKPSREVGMPRNTRENMSIPGNVFDCQHARRDPEELHNYSRNLATPSGITDDVEDSEKRRNWENWERRTIAINTFTLLFSKSKEKKSRRQISLMSMTNHVLGIWTCTQVAWQFRVVSTRRCICKNFLTKRNFKAGS